MIENTISTFGPLIMAFFSSGFGEIDQDDQINLIKQGSFEVMMCRFCNLVDYKKGNMFDPEMKIKCPRWLSYNVSSEKKVPQVKRIKIVPILKMQKPDKDEIPS